MLESKRFIGGSLITVIGVGPGAPEYIAPIAWKKAEDADVLVGSKRALERFSSLGKKAFVIERGSGLAIKRLKSLGDCNVAVLVSGDPGLFSFLAVLKRHFPSEEIEVYPGISSAQLFMARLVNSWDDVRFFSVHGRSERILDDVAKAGGKACLFLDGKNSANRVARMLAEKGVRARAFVGLRLSYGDEKIIEADLAELARMDELSNEENAILYLEMEGD